LIEENIGGVEVIGNPKNPRTGAFEVYDDEKTYHSKLESGKFPTDYNDVVKSLRDNGY